MLPFFASLFTYLLILRSMRNLNYIRHRDIELLKSTVFGSPFRDDAVPSKSANYYVGRFVQYISESDQNAFELLDAYVKSYMLSELLIFENVSEINRPFKNIDFYLDTQFALRALGYSYPQLSRACNELKDMIYAEAGNLYVFKHTVDEIVGILWFSKNQLRTGNPKASNEVVRYCIANHVTPSDLQIEIELIEKHLEESRIKIKEIPPHERQYEIGEKELTAYLDVNYRYRNPTARDRDVDSISAIYRLRKSKRPKGIRDCDVVFVTTNAPLAKHTYSFLYKEERYTYFPLLITDRLATNLLWARNPKKHNNISKQQLLADAFALTNPSERIWEKYCLEVDKLQQQNRLPKEEAIMFLLSSETERAVMDITKGGEIEPNEENIFDIIMLAKEKLTYEERKRVEELKNEIEEYKKKDEQLEAKNQEIGSLKQELVKQQSDQFKAIITINKIANLAAWLTVSIPAVLIILALFNFTPPPYSFISSVTLAVLTFFNLFFGATLIKMRRYIEIYISRKLTK